MNVISHSLTFAEPTPRTDADLIAEWLVSHTPTPCPAVACAPIQGGLRMLVEITAPKRRGRSRKHQSLAGRKSAKTRRKTSQIRLTWLRQAYLADPSPETIRRIAAERKCGVWYIRKRLRAAGIHDGNTASRMEKMK